MRIGRLCAVLAVVLAFSGWAQYGPGEIYHGGIRLQFSGRLTTAGTCQQPAQNVIHCQIPEGTATTVELTAMRTPVGAVNIRAEALPSGWPTFPVASGWGTVTAQYRFTPPAGSAGRQFTLRFKAWTAGVIGELELRVILDIVRAVTPTPPPTEPTAPPTYGPFTGTSDGAGRFEVPIPTLPNTSVTGKLTECTVRPLSNTSVSVTLIPKPGRTIRSAGDIGAVRVSSPGYIETEIVQLMLASSIDIFGRTYVTADVGTVCLRPTGPVTPPPVTPTGPITGTTDSAGKFTASPLPGTTVTGTLTECGKVPLPNTTFTLSLVPKGEVIASPDDIAGFTFAVSGYAATTVTQFSKFSLFGLTWHDTGIVCLYLTETPPCKEVSLRALSQNVMLIPEVPEKYSPHRDARAKELEKLLGRNGEWGKNFDIICLQEVWHYGRSGHFQFKNAALRGWFNRPQDILDDTVAWFSLDRKQMVGAVELIDRRPAAARKVPRVTFFQAQVVGKEEGWWAAVGPDSTAGFWRWTWDSGLLILSRYPIVAISAFIFSDQAGAQSVLEPWTTEELTNKGALYARIQLDPENPDCYIHVFNTHLAADEANAGHRQTQLGELVEFINNCVQADGHPIILCGDFNIIGGSQEWKDRFQNLIVAAGRLEDVWLKLGKTEQPAKDAATWAGNDQNTGGAPWGPRNALATGPGNFQRLDYIFYFPGQRGLTLKPEFVSREPATQRAQAYPWGGFTVSDHLGVTATFKVAPK